jgi:hypothetical protein
MGSGLSRHIHANAHDWGQVLTFRGKIGQSFRSFTIWLTIFLVLLILAAVICMVIFSPTHPWPSLFIVVVVSVEFTYFLRNRDIRRIFCRLSTIIELLVFQTKSKTHKYAEHKELCI